MTFGRDDDEVRLGYKNPPPWSRFTKGRSGNPKGRPKKKAAAPTKAPNDSAVDDVLRDEMTRTVRVNDAKGSRELDMLEVITRAQATAAAKGNPHAQQYFLKEARALEVRDAARKAAEEEKRRESFGHAVLWKKAQTELWTAAACAGVEPAEPWPHPDDMFLNEAELKYWIRGPSCESDLPLFEYYRAERDRIFTQAVLRTIEESASSAKPLLACCAFYDQLLPKRWQVLNNDKVWRRMETRTTRQLHEELERHTEHAKQLEQRAKLPLRDKETYRIVNEALKPMLKAHGYRSFAQFQRAYEENRAGQV